MRYKSSALSITLLMLASGQAIAAETAIIPEFDAESLQLPLDIEQHWVTGIASSYAIARTSETSVKLPSFTKTKDQPETTNTQLAAVSVQMQIFPAPLLPLIPKKYLDMGYYSPLKDLLWNADNNGTQIVQTPDVAPPPPLYPSKPTTTPISTPISTPATAKPIEPAIKPVATTAKTTPETSKWGYGIHAKLSTTGFIGADVGYKFSPNLNARLGINTLGFSTNYGSEGIDYNASFTPTNIHLGRLFSFGGGCV